MRTETLVDRLTKATNNQIFGVACVLLRLAVGLEFFFAGIAKFGDWSAASYLQAANGPLAAWFQGMAGSGLVNALNAWGLTLIGLALILGLLVRPASMFGMLIMALYYLAHFVDNTAFGYIDTHIVHIIILLLFTAGGAGQVFGLNSLLTNTMRRPSALTKFLIG